MIEMLYRVLAGLGLMRNSSVAQRRDGADVGLE